MPEHIHVDGEGPLTLPDAAFVAAGGQGRVFAIGSRAYKLAHDPAHALPPAKLRELAALRDPAVLAPQRLVRTHARGPVIGHAMPFLTGAWSLVELVPRAFRRKHGLDPARIVALIGAMREVIERVHALDMCVVDLNEANVLVQPDRLRPAFIDVDSWQTPQHPATAITPAVLDPRVVPGAGRFPAGSDWFSFAVLTYQLLCGVHPFKGKHPRLTGLRERMLAGCSVLDPQVVLPPSADGPDVIPPRLRAWYRDVFSAGHRGPPPEDAHGGSRWAQPRAVAPRTSPSALSFAPWLQAQDEIEDVCVDVDPPALITARGVEGPGRTLVAGAAMVVRGPDGAAVLLHVDAHGVRVDGDARGQPTVVRGTTTVAGTGYVLGPGHVAVLELARLGRRVHLVPRPVAVVMPLASRMFDGVVLDDILGRRHALLLHPRGRVQRVALPELDGRHVVDARHERGVLVVLEHTRAGYRQHTFVIDDAGRTHTVQEDASAEAIDFTVTEQGLLVEHRGDRLYVWARRGETARVLPLPNDLRDVRLRGDGGVLALDGPRVLRVSLRAG